MAHTYKNSVKYGNSGLLNDMHIYKGLSEYYLLEVSDSVIRLLWLKKVPNGKKLETSLGVPAPVLYLGGGWAHMKNVTESNLQAFTCLIMPDYGDAPEDHETVREGINWYHEIN